MRTTICGLSFGVWLLLSSLAAAQDLKLDLQAKDAAKDWIFLDKSARIDGGELTFDSRKGHGTTFYVRLPIDGRPAAGAAA